MRPTLLALLLCACATVPTAPRTRYDVGDYVVYRYQGTALAEPVTLREEVAARQGNRLRIDVTATRPSGERRWIQVLTDTPANQAEGRVDALWEQGPDGAWTRLANEGNKDLERLYEWTTVRPDGRATGVARQPCERGVLGHALACRCTTGQNAFSGAIVLFEQTECPDFLWTNGPARFTDAATGEDVLRVEVVEQGRRADRPPQPLEPAAP